MASGPATLSAVGDEFIVNMRNDILGEYQMKNTVTVFEQNKTIGWAPELYPIDGYRDKIGDMQATGHSYTWILEPAGEGRTKVTQVYDWSGVNDPNFRGIFPLVSEEHLDASIDRAAQASK